jgi:signal peptidase I
MADEHAPVPSPHSSPRFPTPSSLTPSDNGKGVYPKSDSTLSEPAAPSEMVLFGRWLLGCLLVFGCGWAVLLAAIFLLRGSHFSHPEIIFAVVAALDLILFLFLERDFRLSRYMGLRIEPGTHFWQSAVMLWLFNVPGLLFRPTNFHPEREAQAAARRRTAAQANPRGDSVREIVETIVFVVVLVLLLKSFAAEAFVIPTGSMGQTLLGYQKEVVCPDCGLKFPINCSSEVDPSEGSKPNPVFACVCPNCRQHIHFGNAPPNYGNDNPDSRLIDDPGWNSGDRVLVAKFVYDLFRRNPNRLDVVVFKFPGGGERPFPVSGPYRNHVPMNYIKRLIGEPGETIAIRSGKLYALSPEKGLRYDDYERAKQDPDLMATLWQRDYMHRDDREAHDRFEAGQFQILRKNPENILSMMRLVYDNDHPSKSVAETANRWRGVDPSWSAHGTHGFRRDGGDGGETAWLRYHHIIRVKGNECQQSLITDIMGYNTYQNGGLAHQLGHAPLLGNNWASDLILECEATLEAPQGQLTLELSKGVDRFQARWDLSTGVCTLLRKNSDGEQTLDSKPTTLKKKGTYKLRFANVDERLVVWVDGDLPFDQGVPYAAAKELGPRVENDFEPASVGVRGATVALDKLKLFRDTYYTMSDSPSSPDVGGVDFTKPDTWDALRNPPLLTMYVQPDHFLCLGDNSPESSDGRTWGAVPRRLLLGRALLVYYPFGRGGRIR